ncbi:MAG: peptide-methionine (R)-S-oxide reductase [Candidatus Andersenbacteria bacterium]
MTEEIYTNTWDEGNYRCSHCGQVLFDSDAKFKSGTRWPSFRSARPGTIHTRPDHSLGMERTEILCSRCGQHLGHVFPDGEISGDTHPAAGNRFCVLSSALVFAEKEVPGKKEH